MKKYFVRRLALDKEIKIGDLIRSESFGNPATKVTGFTENGDYITDESDSQEPIFTDSYFVVKKDKAQKITDKLFICSKDIKINSIVHTTDGDRTTATKSTVEFLKKYNNNSSFVVIGAISDEATWVKEGDKFDAGDLFAEGFEQNWDEKYSNRVFKIKGPCGHFH